MDSIKSHALNKRGGSHKDLTPDLRDVCGPYFDPSTVH